RVDLNAQPCVQHVGDGATDIVHLLADAQLQALTDTLTHVHEDTGRRVHTQGPAPSRDGVGNATGYGTDDRVDLVDDTLPQSLKQVATHLLEVLNAAPNAFDRVGDTVADAGLDLLPGQRHDLLELVPVLGPRVLNILPRGAEETGDPVREVIERFLEGFPDLLGRLLDGLPRPRPVTGSHLHDG